jgi:hypothetical protein
MPGHPGRRRRPVSMNRGGNSGPRFRRGQDGVTLPFLPLWRSPVGCSVTQALTPVAWAATRFASSQPSRVGDTRKTSATPGLACAVPNMKHARFVRLNRPISEIRITAHGHSAYSISPDRASDAWVLADRLDGAPDRQLDVQRASRAAFVKMVEDSRKIVQRPPRIAAEYRPCCFQRSAISVSVANSPRVACAKPSR